MCLHHLLPTCSVLGDLLPRIIRNPQSEGFGVGVGWPRANELELRGERGHPCEDRVAIEWGYCGWKGWGRLSVHTSY
jgi:hypothetical protein